MSANTLTSSYNLTPFRLAALYPPAKIRADLYIETNNASDPFRLYTRAANPPSTKDLDHLARQGTSELYVSFGDANQLREQYRELLNSDIDIPADIKLEMIREEAKADFTAAWKGKETDNLLTQATRFTDSIVSVCHGEIDTTSVMQSLMAHDSDTFNHVSNVCTYAVILSQHLGIKDEKQLTDIGLAALLHDIGKRKINSDILKKPGALSPEERSIIFDHPRIGFEELCENSDWSQEQLMMIYHHHEKLNGSGYPVGLGEDEIGWSARLCAVVDVFDAFTMRRSYRKPVTVEDAVVYLEQNTNTFFDAEMVKCWSNLVRNVISK